MEKNLRKRPSLITSNPLVQEEFAKRNLQKRASVNWNLKEGDFKSANLQKMKAVLIDGTEEKKDSEKQKEFKQARRKSVKDEFTMAKELLKNTKIEEELDEGEEKIEKIENTKKNIDIGKECDDNSQGSVSDEEKKE